MDPRDSRILGLSLGCHASHGDPRDLWDAKGWDQRSIVVNYVLTLPLRFFLFFITLALGCWDFGISVAVKR